MNAESSPVRIGELQVAEKGIMRAILGSCVGIAILCEEPRIAGLAHCLLPEGEPSPTEKPARYVTSGLRNLLRALDLHVRPERVFHTYIAGGACMFPGQKIEKARQVGLQNLRTCRKELRARGIRFRELETGGLVGCEIHVDCEQRQVSVKVLKRGEP